MDVSLIRRDKLAFFCVAVAALLIVKVCMNATEFAPQPLLTNILNLSVATFLLSSNLPHLTQNETRRNLFLRRAEFVSFGIAVSCFIIICVLRGVG